MTSTASTAAVTGGVPVEVGAVVDAAAVDVRIVDVSGSEDGADEAWIDDGEAAAGVGDLEAAVEDDGEGVRTVFDPAGLDVVVASRTGPVTPSGAKIVSAVVGVAVVSAAAVVAAGGVVSVVVGAGGLSAAAVVAKAVGIVVGVGAGAVSGVAVVVRVAAAFASAVVAGGGVVAVIVGAVVVSAAAVVTGGGAVSVVVETVVVSATAVVAGGGTVPVADVAFLEVADATVGHTLIVGPFNGGTGDCPSGRGADTCAGVAELPGARITLLSRTFTSGAGRNRRIAAAPRATGTCRRSRK